MTSKKSGFFSNLFSRKKSNKENELPEQQQEQFWRTQSVRGSRRPHRTSHFEGNYSPEYPNPYHGNVKPRKHPRGPQSCPGGVRDESYHEDHYEESRSQYARAQPRHEKFRRSARDTSEYGSGDPSPITMSNRHPNYNTSLIDDSETEDYRGESRISKYSDLARQCEMWKEKYENAVYRKEVYKTNLRKLKSAKEETEQAFNDRMQSLKVENGMLRHQLGTAKAELTRMQQQHQQQQFNNSFAHQNSFFQPQPALFPSSGFASQPQYGNFHTPRLPAASHAPMTGSALTAGTSSTLDSTLAAGAGEALVQPSDMSFQPNMDSSFSAKSFADEDEENVKQFPNYVFEDTIETARTNVSSSSLGLRPQRDIRLVRQSDESHASSSTVVADVMYPPMKSGSDSMLRRTASDGILN